MTPIFPNLPATLGVYTLVRRLGSQETSERYIAKQSHVERAVVVEVLRPGLPQAVQDAFLRNARARVTVSMPRVGQVLESMASKGMWYTTLECPEGTPLSRMREQGKSLTTQQVCLVVEQIAQIYESCAAKDIAAGGLTEDAIFIKNKTEVTVLSPVISGKHQPSLVPVQQGALAAALRPVRPVGVPGETRVNTLLDWMEHEVDGQRLDWTTIAATANLIRTQVAPIIGKQNIATAGGSTTAAAQARRQKEGIRRMVRIGGGACLGVLLLTCTGFIIGPLRDVGEIQPVRDGYAMCTTAKGEGVALMERPVTIAEYNKFLDAYNEVGPSATPGLRDKVNKGIPGEELEHTPKDWDAQWKAAVGGKKWHGRRLSPDSPVTGVSYWDAMAYANYAGGHLPDPNMLRTARGAIGSAEYTEWTSYTRPADPLYEKAHLLLPAAGSDTPLLENDPAARRDGRAFRLYFPEIPPADTES